MAFKSSPVQFFPQPSHSLGWLTVEVKINFQVRQKQNVSAFLLWSFSIYLSHNKVMSVFHSVSLNLEHLQLIHMILLSTTFYLKVINTSKYKQWERCISLPFTFIVIISGTLITVNYYVATAHHISLFICNHLCLYLCGEKLILALGF